MAGIFAGWATSSPAAVTLQIGQNFKGSTFGVDSHLTPADANGAVGPRHFVELINGRFSVYDKTNGSRVQTQTDLAFWRQAGVSFPTGWQTTDPRVVYDPTVERWFASQIDYDSSGAITTNRFLLAISSGADPTGPWSALAIPSDPTGVTSADFPTLGLDGQGVYLSGDMFDAADNPIRPVLLSIPKAGLLNSPPATNEYTRFDNLSYASQGEILQPAICLDGSGVGIVLATGGLGFDEVTLDFITNNTLVSFEFQNVTNPGQATLSAPIVIPVPGYTAPFNPPQPNPALDLDDGDSRLSARIYLVQGVLYAIHSTEVDNRAALRWYRLDATNHTLLEAGTITDPNLDLFYPSIAANANGTVVVGCNGSSAQTFVSAYALAGQTVAGVTTFGKLLLLKSGTASYTDGGATSRWGDYSATSVDPADPTRFWTIQMYPSSSGAWSTQITELLTSSVFPSLSISRSGTNVMLAWPASATGFNLEATDSLAPPNWVVVSQSPALSNGQFSVLIPVVDGPRFFRLHQP